MWTKKLAAMLLAAVVIFSAASPAFAENNKNVIRVTGVAFLSKEKSKSSFYKSFARQVAKMDALRKLAECTPAFKVGIKDEIITKIDVEDAKLAKYLKSAHQVGNAKFTVNEDESLTCEVLMEMPNNF